MERPSKIRGAWLAGACRFLVAGIFAAGGAISATAAEPVFFSSAQSYDEIVLRALPAGTLIDLRSVELRVANSANSSPDKVSDCETGPLPLNRYPMRVYDSTAVALRGGRFDGEVPQGSDWVHTYCNSAAIGLWNSPHGSVEDIRIRKAWDGVRIGPASSPFLIARAWLSDVRDDCIENDFQAGGIVLDVLLDGCFSGISLRGARKAEGDRPQETVLLAGVLLRMRGYLYRGEIKQALPVKTDGTSPSLVIQDSVIALDDTSLLSPAAIGRAFGHVESCRNNLFLWLSDRTWPNDLARPPDCFRVLRGDEARATWERVRTNWINCHIRAVRFADDTRPVPAHCDRAGHGGLY